MDRRAADADQAGAREEGKVNSESARAAIRSSVGDGRATSLETEYMRLAVRWFAVASFGLVLAVMPPPVTAVEVTLMPEQNLFRLLLADPKELLFQASILSVDTSVDHSRYGVVGFGENFGIARWAGRHAGEAWQLSLSAGVLAQFDLDAPSDDLVNADYIVGFPVTYRNNRWSVRVRFYHQSSHLGDEFLLRTNTDRVNLSFESLEALVSYDWEQWRAYGGGEYLVFREPEELKPGILRFGIEHRAREPLRSTGTYAGARLVAGLDARSWEQYEWNVAWSLKTGLEFRRPPGIEGSGHYWNLLMQFYIGPVPFGQFYTYKVKYWGLGLVLHL